MNEYQSTQIKKVGAHSLCEAQTSHPLSSTENKKFKSSHSSLVWEPPNNHKISPQIEHIPIVEVKSKFGIKRNQHIYSQIHCIAVCL